MDEQVDRDLTELGVAIAAIELSLMAVMRSVFSELPEAALVLDERYPQLLNSMKGKPEHVAAVRARTERLLRSWIDW